MTAQDHTHADTVYTWRELVALVAMVVTAFAANFVYQWILDDPSARAQNMLDAVTWLPGLIENLKQLGSG